MQKWWGSICLVDRADIQTEVDQQKTKSNYYKTTSVSCNKYLIRKLSAHERFGINRGHPILSRYFVFNDRSGWNFN